MVSGTSWLLVRLGDLGVLVCVGAVDGFAVPVLIKALHIDHIIRGTFLKKDMIVSGHSALLAMLP